MSGYNTGDVRLVDNSASAKNGLKSAVRRALMVIGLKVERYAKANCTERKAVETVLLRNTITIAVAVEAANVSSYTADRGKGDKPQAMGTYRGTAEGNSGDATVYIGSNVEYAPYIELGTAKMGPRSFLHNAAADHADEYKKIFANELERG